MPWWEGTFGVEVRFLHVSYMEVLRSCSGAFWIDVLKTIRRSSAMISCKGEDPKPNKAKSGLKLGGMD